MSDIFKKGNYLKCSWNNKIIKIIIENPTKKDFQRCFDHSVLYEEDVFISQYTSDVYDWFHKDPRDFELIPYMSSPLWEVLNV